MAALHLSQDHATAIAEYMQGLIHPGTLTPFDVNVGSILDPTDWTICDRLDVDHAFPTLPWRAIRDLERRDPDSWTFARDAVDAGFHGLRVPSALGRGIDLVLWPWGEGGGEVRAVDPHRELG